MNALGKFIAEHRIAKKLSLRKLAKIANVSHTEIYRLENGTRKHPSPLLLKSIAHALGANFDEIMKAAEYTDDYSPSPVTSVPIFGVDDLTEQEVEEVRDFIDFLRNKRRRANERNIRPTIST